MMQEKYSGACSEWAKALRRVTAMALLPPADSSAAMRSIFAHTKWTLLATNTLRSGIDILQTRPVAVAITESTLPDGTWRDLLDCVKDLEVPPRLIVTSPLADERLWAEVLNLGGYDVLAQPFDFKEVTRVFGLAWLGWKRECHARSGYLKRQTGAA